MVDTAIVEAIDIMRRERRLVEGSVCPACDTIVSSEGRRSCPEILLDHTDTKRGAAAVLQAMDEIAEFWEAHL